MGWRLNRPEVQQKKFKKKTKDEYEFMKHAWLH